MEPTGPGRWRYVVAGLLAAAALAVLGVALVGWGRNLASLGQQLQRVSVPGEAHVELPEAGTYAVFHEYHTVLDGQPVANPSQLPGLRLSVTAPDDPAIRLPVETLDGPGRGYRIDGRRGVAGWHVEVSEPGQYRLRTSYPPDAQGPQAVLALGLGIDDQLEDATVWLVTGIIGFVILATSAAVIFVLTLFRRRLGLRHSARRTPVPEA